MIKYRTRWNSIDAIEVDRETAKQVVLKSGIRENKVSDWSNWHDTWEDAHAFLVKNAELAVERLRTKLERAKGELGQIKGMKQDANSAH